MRDRAGAIVPEVTVKLDGEVVTAHSASNAVSVDPGEHRFEVSARGYVALTKRVAIAEGVRAREEIIVLERSVSPQSTAPDRRPVDEHESESQGDTQRLLGLGVGAAGVLALAIGAISGAAALGSRNGRDKACGGSNLFPRACDAANKDEVLDAQADVNTYGDIATIAFIAGAVLSTSGAVLYFTAPRHSTIGIRATPAMAGIVITKGW